jgi:nicotinamidase-related amidase
MAKIEPDAPDLASLMFNSEEKPKSLNDRFHGFKRKLSKEILSWAYRVGLGYTTLAESYEAHNDNLFRELVIEAQNAQRRDATTLFAMVSKGNLLLLTEKLNKIERDIKAAVHRKYSDIKDAGSNMQLISKEVEHLIQKSEIYKRDVAGANIVHVAYLTKNYEIGHYLVRRYPILASLPYNDDITGLIQHIEPKHGSQNRSVLKKKLDALRRNRNLKADGSEDSKLSSSMLYTGENILHMTIIRRNYEEVRWLLDFYKDHRYSFPQGLANLLNANTTGTFFDRRGSFYFGSNPLQFAVCSNSISIFDLVYSFVTGVGGDDGSADDADMQDTMTVATSSRYVSVGPDVIFATDQFGNNVLHLCVLHGLSGMYEHVHNTALAVMSRRLYNLYLKHKEEEINSGGRKPSSAGMSIKISWPDEEFRKGFVMKEKVLRITEDCETSTWVAEEAARKVEELLVRALNEDLLSPLTFAAQIIDKSKDSEDEMVRKVDMFRYLVEKMKKKLWEYGPVTMSILDLEGIEIKYNVLQHYQCNGREAEVKNIVTKCAIDYLCINDSDQATMIPEIVKLIQAKWERVGYPLFILSFFIHVTLTVCVTLILIFVNATPVFYTQYGTEIAVDVLYVIVGTAYMIMFIQEAHNIIMFGWKFISLRGIALFEKVLRLTKMLSFVTFCVMKGVALYRGEQDIASSQDGATVYFNHQDDQGIKITIVVCVIASYLHLYYYFMGFDSTGPFVLTMFRIITSDVPYFMNFYFIVVVAFACALAVLSNTGDPEASFGFLHLLKAVYTLIQNTVGADPTHDNIGGMDFYPRNQQWLADILITCYNVSVSILMINLLIAMISNTYAAYCEYNDAFLLMAKYNVMDAMQSVMWDHELKDNIAKFAQIEENLLIETVGEEDYTSTREKVKPGGATNNHSSDSLGLANKNGSSSPVRPSNPRVHSAASGNSVHSTYRSSLGQHSEVSSVQRQNLTKYLFEMKTVNAKWCSSDSSAQDVQDSSNNTKDTRKTTLFIIDPQVDFHPGGTLAIPAAGADSQRIADMIDSFGSDHIHDIFVSMDSHNPCHIAHAVSWHAQGKPQEHPPAFTQITHRDVMDGVWEYADKSPKQQEWVRNYTLALERKGRMKLTIWPEHCIIGSNGHSVVPVIDAALQRWAQRSERHVNYVMKGQNLRCEMYSALCAEVEDPLDPTTGLNHELLAMLKIADRVRTSSSLFLCRYIFDFNF